MSESSSGSGDDPFAVGVAEWTLDAVRSRVSSVEEELRLIGLLAATDREQQTSVALGDLDRRMAMSAGRDVLESRGFTLVVDADLRPGPPGLLDLVGVSDDHRRVLVVETAGGDEIPVVTREIAGVVTERGSAAYLNDSLHRDGRWLDYLRGHRDVARGLADRSVTVDYLEVFGRSDGKVEVSTLRLGPDALRLDDLLPDATSGAGATQ